MGAALLITACGGDAPQTAPEEEAGRQEVFVPIVSATGEVLPARWATLSLSSPGIVTGLPIEVGDQVEAGELLVVLSGREQLEAALAAAQLEYVNASQAIDQLMENESLARAQAEQGLALARDVLEDVEYQWRVKQEGLRANSDTINAAEANLILAEEEVKQAQKRYNRLSGRAEDDPARALALSNLSAARQKRDSILRNLNWYRGRPTEVEQALLDADVAIAQARVDDAERTLGRLQDGPDPRLSEAAEARLANGEAALKAAQRALAELERRAPFAGTVSEVFIRANEWIAPGQPAVRLADLSTLRVETTDLNEIDAAQVELGDGVTVSFDALADVVVPGTVTSISPKAAEGSGVNFTVLIELEEIPEKLRWGMTAFVDIEVGGR